MGNSKMTTSLKFSTGCEWAIVQNSFSSWGATDAHEQLISYEQELPPSTLSWSQHYWQATVAEWQCCIHTTLPISNSCL